MTLVGTKVAQFRIEGTLGHGGMGDVYAARDETLERRVALKAIRAEKRLSPHAKARFLLEARTLSRLEHPNICRIYDYVSGDDADFLVLELVEGETLSRVVADGALDPARKLEIAEQLARVLAVAHEAGVVHRDIKPDNVMLTDDGQIKVLDFGLARPIGSDESAPAKSDATAPAGAAHEPATSTSAPTLDTPHPAAGPLTDDTPTEADRTRTVDQLAFAGTAVGAVLGTPVYMSPEQARGEPATPASDMFSFGMLLQELLTGKRPYPDGLRGLDVLERARAGESLPPEGLDRDVTDLIRRLKSIAPPNRPTAVETASRIAWIRDKPRRRMRRLAVAAAGVVLVLAGMKYTLDLRRERALALEAQREAERRRGQAEELIGFMLGDLREKLSGVGRLELLDDVGDQALRYFESLPADDVTDADLLRRARVMSQIGEVRMAQGDLAAARSAFEESLALSRDLVAREPANTERIAAVGAAEFWIGSVLWSQGDLDGAQARFEAYLDAARRLVEEEPEKPEWQLELAYAHTNVGAARLERGEADAALEAMAESVEIRERLVAVEPDEPRWAEELANGLTWLGSTLEGHGDPRGALVRFREELAIRQRLSSQSPEDADARYKLTIALSHVGALLEIFGELDEAVTHYRRDVDLSKSLVARDPTNTDWQHQLAVSHGRLAAILLARGSVTEAREELAAASRILDELIVQEPTHAEWRYARARVLRHRASYDLARGRLEAAVADARRSRDSFAALAAEDPPNASNRRGLAESDIVLGRVLARSGRPGDAARAWAAAADAVEPVARGSRDHRLLAPWVSALLLLDRLDEARPVAAELMASGYAHPGFLELCHEKRACDGPSR